MVGSLATPELEAAVRLGEPVHRKARSSWLCSLAVAGLLVGCGDDPDNAALDGALVPDSALAPSGAAVDAGSYTRVSDASRAPGDGASGPIPEVDQTSPRAADGGRGAADAGGVASSAPPADAGRAGWKLVFADEFEGAAGSSPDAAKWVFETGGGGFGNNELEYYMARADNAALDGHGKLIITARAESYMGSRYTSARLKTAGKFEHAYGRYEARLRIPKGQGIWPAFWLLGADIGKTPWPACGEIDIMENIGKEPTLIHGTLHGPGYSGGNGIGKSAELPGKVAYSDDFHEFAVEWEDKVVRWYVDGSLYRTRTPSDLPAGAKWAYDHPFFILLNLAVGGQWPGNPDNTTTFPQTLTVDYVRVYER